MTDAVESEFSVGRYELKVSDEALNDLHERLGRTRWPDDVEGSGWEYGVDLTYLRELIRYWREEFDWRAREEQLNRLPNRRATIDGHGIHFLHMRGGEQAIPLLLLHGWPATFVQMTRIAPQLTGGSPSFDVVVPSLPGYGFSDRPIVRGMSAARVAGLLDRLMEGLGYERYAVRASDIGAGVAAALPRRRLLGVHQSGTNPFLQDVPDDLSERERQFVQELRQWVREEFAYGQLHATKPQTPAVALNDSPAGLAAWIVEKYRSWSDCDGDVERRFTKDDLLSNLVIYWATETIGSSMRLYFESMRDWPAPPDAEIVVPNGVAMFPKDMVPTPREFAERQGPIDHWTDMPRGGHFGEWEEPELLADDMRTFFSQTVRVGPDTSIGR